MKEITVVLTAQLTYIAKFEDEYATFVEEHSGGIAKSVITDMKEQLGADDTQLLGKQVFIRDVDDEEVQE